ncbi:hypothetical protein BIV57_04795 [Mangrovactinospora gilvigrisea]|uniref:Low molecular weight protein antigen 6 PH domain-containing protein n=1 Tax=Mangrovactinospora gilvigrisea TaxID=1428644 RepID=A0A1J7BIS5_9ACTN|nr:PH domain-containing protein [Mangrovactinospora gilvigrisea]OIV38575.1 hypothetical protein BIV57_04795 [Mangrovactinospora gilvigrisea]
MTSSSSTGSTGRTDRDGTPSRPAYADRVYRSVPAFVCGVALLLLAAVMLVDALFNSELHLWLTVLAGVVTAAPLIVAFTMRPVVRAGGEGLLVRNPFRTIELPWRAVSDFAAGYSSEVRTVDGKKYQLWSIPVSMRARRRASSRQRKAAMSDLSGRTPVDRPSRDPLAGQPGHDPNRSWADNALDELRSLRERALGGEAEPSADGKRVRWSWPIYVPFAVGAVALVVLNIV